jgi:RepB DNA-primase from phage plasmid
MPDNAERPVWQPGAVGGESFDATERHPTSDQTNCKGHQIDVAAAAHFLKSLDPDATKFTFQTFDDNAERRQTNKAPLKDKKTGELIRDKHGKLVEGKDPFAQIYHGTLDQRCDQLQAFNDLGAGVFVTVNETDLKGRKNANIKRIRVVFTELDGQSLGPVLNDPDLPKPHITVQSSPGEHWHAYWRVTGIALRDFKKVQKALIARFNSDPSVHDLPRVMRLPGFYHRKGQTVRACIVAWACKRGSLEVVTNSS